MRKIKFRAKSWFGGEWQYGLLYNGTGNYTYIKNGQVGVRVNPETIGQWVGILDELGVEIFEGDILSNKLYTHYRSEGGNYLVVYDDDCFAVSENGAGRKYSLGICYHAEVIGNIYDNPELIKN